MSAEAPVYDFGRGWFVVAFSDELPAGAVVPLRYFGRDLVAYRGDDGVPHVLDAHCPHMGAHFGYGGTVKDGCVRCPFHAWKFDSGGNCVDVPYAAQPAKIPPRAKVGAWRTRETHGAVFVWHDPEGREPTYEIPTIADYGSAEWLPWSTGKYQIKTHPREVVENLADKAHFPRVHDTDIDEFGFETDAHTATQKAKGRAHLAGGGIDKYSSSTTYHGPGYLVMKMDGSGLSNYMMFAHTPIEKNLLDLRLAVTLKIVGDRKKTEGYVGMYMANLKSGFEDDIKIWEHKVFREIPVLCDGDGPLGKLRKWYRQFFTPVAAPPGERTAGAAGGSGEATP